MADYYDHEAVLAHATFEPMEAEDLRLIPQSGVQQYIFPDGDQHNAIWDYYVTPDHRHLFSLCAEGNFAQSFSLMEYLPETNDVRKIFDFDDTITHYDDTIKGSKIHTSLCSMPDGRVIFSNHTTASAPGHPVWMPRAYRNHMWEGFPGSNIMIWDPKTNHVEDLGIPIRRESLYGGVFSAKCNAMFCTTMMNGHVYRFDLADRRVTDYGNLTEGDNNMIKIGPDGNVYCTSDAGDLFRINTDTLEYEDLHVRLAPTPAGPSGPRKMMYGLNGPDGKFYIGAQWSEILQSYDPKTGKHEIHGKFMPKCLEKYPHKGMVYGWDFDEDGVLWYGLLTHPTKESRHGHNEITFWLCSWDFLRGGEPVCYGVIGTEKRRVLVFSEAHIDNGRFIGADTNHWNDPVSMFAVDLKKLKADYAAGVKGPFTKDEIHYTHYENGAELYRAATGGDLGRDAAWYYESRDGEKARTEELLRLAAEADFGGFTRAWNYRPFHDFGNKEGKVRELTANADGTVTAIVGTERFSRLVLREGEVLSREDGVAYTPKAVRHDLDSLRLPAAAGRRWIAQATATVTLPDGRVFVGTKDGYCGIVDGEQVFSLGALGVRGPVHDLCMTAGGRVYGIAGSAHDLAMLFTYADGEGLVELGYVYVPWEKVAKGECVTMGLATTVAVSADGKRLYVGSEDFRSTILEYELA